MEWPSRSLTSAEVSLLKCSNDLAVDVDSSAIFLSFSIVLPLMCCRLIKLLLKARMHCILHSTPLNGDYELSVRQLVVDS